VTNISGRNKLFPLRNILLVLRNVLFVHVNREAKNSADLLAKRGVTTKGRIIEWFTQNI